MHLTQSGAAGGLRRRILEIAVGVGGALPSSLPGRFLPSPLTWFYSAFFCF